MDKIRFTSVDEYIASHPSSVRKVLERVRRIIRKAVPGAAEAISYGIPAYKLHGRPVVYFAGWKQHYALYPSSGRLVALFGKDLAGYEVAKGTIRFPLSDPVPVQLIERIARFRAGQVAEAEEARAAASKERRARTAGRGAAGRPKPAS